MSKKNQIKASKPCVTNSFSMKFMEEKNPLRIRSKLFLLIYPLEINAEDLKMELMSKFKVTSDESWMYIVKTETYENKQNKLLVLLEFSTQKDISPINLHIVKGTHTIKGIYRGVKDKEIALLYIMKSIEQPIYITNIDKSYLDSYNYKMITNNIPLFEQSVVSNDEVTTVLSSQTITETKNPMNDMTHRQKFQQHLLDYNTERISRNPDLDVLKTHLAKARNYYNNQSLKVEQDLNLLYEECEKDLFKFRKTTPKYSF